MSVGPIFSPPVPFSTYFPNGVNNGTMVIVSGAVLSSGDCFEVNFKCGQAENDDIAFHFKPRFDRGHVVCNTMEHEKWGNEEIKYELPFHREQPFEIRILVTNNDYKVSVNRHNFLEYYHRIPLHRVNTLAIKGCVSLIYFEIQAQGSTLVNPGVFPPANYAIPYTSIICGGLFPCKVIVIRGAVGAHHPKSFQVNLKFSGGIAFHFNPRFHQCTIVRNSFLNNSWGEEELEMPSCGMSFAPGQSFVMEIVCENHHFRVNVNGNHVCNFNHRVPHLQQIDTLQVEGDVVLQHVQI
ncbi:galectin-9-like [Rhinoderma darwinii]|uniref:galectin-9-like n=1 Tax=Rhinoderma darwinii TaxID=43563 RepID=UPI003F66EE7C